MHTIRKKYVWYSLFLVLCVAIGAFYRNVERTNLSPEVVTVRFYATWQSAFAGNLWTPYVQGIHVKSPYVSDTFTRSAERGYEKGVDVVWCHAPLSSVVTFQDVRADTERMSARVDLLFGNHEANVYVVQDTRGRWYIDEVDCTGASPSSL